MKTSRIEPAASHPRRRQWRRIAAVAGMLVLSACDPTPAPPVAPPPTDQWREFHGSWNAVGTRRSIPLGAERRAGIVDLAGTMLLSGPERPGVGFRAEAIGLGDSATGVVGRAVWTDENGDRVFSEFRGAGTATGNRIEGTFLGGTGRYAAAEGTYQFTWQYVVETDDGSVQGRAVGLTGRVRVGPSQLAPQTRETRP